MFNGLGYYFAAYIAIYNIFKYIYREREIDTYIMQKKTKIRSASTSNNNVLGNNNNIIQEQNYTNSSKNSS